MRIGSLMWRLVPVVFAFTIIQGINAEPSAAQSNGRGLGAPKNRPLTMTAHFFSRKSDTVAISEDKEVLLEPGKLVKFNIGEFKIWAKRSEDPYEAPSLVIDVSDRKTGKRINHLLYQYGTNLHNQFAGGHGFTGLNYDNAPHSQAELQYWCDVNR